MMRSRMDACDSEARTGKESDSNPIGGDAVDLVHLDNNHHRSPPSYQIGLGPDGIGGGPTYNYNHSSSSSHIYNTIGDVSFAGLKTLQQPFELDIARAVTAAASGMAATMGFPFTNAQWKELERQALIYKYMVASVPVPHDLLFPVTRNSTAAAPVAVGSDLNLTRFSKGGDLEPGRCRRTDGKKWRCSRDVAPDQKYCERHLCRGRPRSRKPVELAAINKKKTPLQPYPNTNLSASPSPSPSPSQFVGNFTQNQRGLRWMMKGEAEAVNMAPSTGQEWHHLINNSSDINQHYVDESLNLNSFTNLSSGDQQSNDCPLFINPDLVPRGFIDAWSSGVSNEDHNANSGTKTSVSSSGNLSFSPLSLSMGGNDTVDKDMGQLQMGLGVVESSQEHECGTKPPLSSWLSPVSWAGFTPGGPLAEVLRPSTVTASGPPSPAAGIGDSDSPSATTLSSPSGVLQKRHVSWSDSSGNSSPTLASSKTNKPASALLWLLQRK